MDICLLKVSVAVLLLYIIAAPYTWWQKALDDRDMYKSMYEGTQNELDAVYNEHCVILPPPVEG